MKNRHAFIIGTLITVTFIVIDWVGATFGTFWGWVAVGALVGTIYHALKENDGWEP